MAVCPLSFRAMKTTSGPGLPVGPAWNLLGYAILEILFDYD